jgi:phosphoglycolate phosphatase
MTIRTVIFDMDGTLVQSRGAAWEVFQDTVKEFDLDMTGPEQFFDLFRENFFAALRAFVGEPAKADAVSEHFLVNLRKRYTPELTPGMTDVVHALAGHYSLAVISSNAMDAIRRTLEHAGVAQCFAHVFAGDVEPDKAAAIHRILADPSYGTIRRCAPDYVEEGHLPERATADQIVLITDTIGDVREGVRCGIRVLGVAWGMHSVEELRATGAEFVALWPQELVAALLPDGYCTPGGCRCLSCDLPVPTLAGAVPARPAPRDVHAETAAANRVRRARRATVPAAAAAHGCGCDGPSCSTANVRRDDPYLSYALSIIAAGGKVS